MKIRKIALLAAGVISFAATKAQETDANLAKESYYRVPMDIPILLSANFAEMRANHFHAGIDIKTQGTEGHKVFSAADGHVTRAGISPGGYGKALYIDHPNGTTTVYAHLLKFTPAIEKYVDDWRYANKKHSGDVYFKASQFPVKKGELIGFSGNTGMSGGPHLHYEVRESATQEPTNVVARGYIQAKDNIPPRIVRLYCIQTDSLAAIPMNGKPKAVELKQESPRKYSLAAEGPLTIPQGCYFLLEVTDRKNDVSNTFGVYAIKMTVDGQTTFDLKLDKFSFANNRYKHAVSYYPLQRNTANEVFRLAKMQGNRIPVYGTIKNRGVLVSVSGQQHDVEIEVMDDSGNTSTLSFTTQGSTAVKQKKEPNKDENTAVYFMRPFDHSQDGLSVSIPAGALYESVFYKQTTSASDSQTYKTQNAKRRLYSPIYTILSDDIAMHKSMTISIEADAPEHLRPKLCLGYINSKGAMSSAGGQWKDGAVTGSVRSFGRYCVVTDTIPPKVSASFASGADLSAAKQISFDITDDFAGIWDFEATIDGKWILLDWRIPQRKIVHAFDSSRFDYAGKIHQLRLVVKDGRGNETVWEGTFRK